MGQSQIPDAPAWALSFSGRPPYSLEAKGELSAGERQSIMV